MHEMRKAHFMHNKLSQASAAGASKQLVSHQTH
jgi:hypothetical protein